MIINELASSFLHVKESRDEHIRIIDYVLKNDLVEIQKDYDGLARNLSLISKKNEIEIAKQSLALREIELLEVSNDLLQMMKDRGMKPGDRYAIQIEDQIYFDVWYLDGDEVCTAGSYHHQF